MWRVILLYVAVLAATAAPSEKALSLQWNSFKNTYNKVYNSSTEEARRFEVFKDNSIMIATHNEKYSKGLVSYELGINEFADLYHDEFLRMMTGYLGESLYENASTFRPASGMRDSNVPEVVDWRKKGAVTEVKNQGACGSCWAFSATGSIEGHHFLKHGKLVSLSEQNLVDCTRVIGNHGCKSGLMSRAFEYVRKNGIDTEESYPYEARDGPCRFRPQFIGAKVTGFRRIPRGSEKLLKMAVGLEGPVSVGIDASKKSFVFYKKGVYNEPQCSNTRLHHAVLIVGYGVDNGTKYWIVKNSWSSRWGINGYVYMSRERNNQCGIATDAIFPLV